MSGSFQIWGLGGGIINTQDLIDLELYSLEMKKLPYTTRKNDLTTLQSSYNKLKNQLSDFTSMLSSYSLYRGSSKGITYSKEGYVSATASSSAISGSYSIDVQQLATHHQLKSTGKDVNASLGDLLDWADGEEEKVININNTEIKLTSDMTATDLLQRINSAGAGVRAYAIQNTMFMVSDAAGTKNDIKLDDAAKEVLKNVLGFEDDGKLQDAEFTVNGVKLTSSSNTVTDALPGVTLELTRATAGETINFEIGNTSAEDLFDKIKEFVDVYNKARTTLNENTGEGGALTGKAAARALQGVLSSMSGFTKNGLYNFSIGLSVDKDGVLSLDEDKLKESIAANHEGVQDFFFGIGGLSGVMNREMDAVFGTSGLVTKELDSISDQLKKITDKVDTIDKQNKLLEESIVAKYAGFEVRMGNLNAQLTMMQALIKSMNSSNNKD